MNNNFCERLFNYRMSLGIETKREMADKLEISEQLYNMLENGKRTPSQKVLDKLFLISNKPEEYWLYGIEDEKNYIEKREEYKMTKRAVDQLIELGMIKDENFTTAVEEVLIAALKADVKHILKRKSK
ncbi:helix-turn-helix domain-containing protein [Clostridium cochlearium]|uniref:helix-turn-helix domain-containing protein n=1 Tax=Clostridium cochlearium TaxID=1494 RepID=UPI001570D90C|nr:helix-turn-helix transcriptional regulator [Bacteroidales bacterium MSK.15.36]MCG4571730.1 helix-turn-helix transcriptional regulator [Clostridium cochlearium]MCG4579059.1 helix-turn-helix transcriptional regulator [Clostridium cochlearium]NSJ90181.1 helix-turn-helix transcriptional regulator [Coprococcus sp. MSK.21.13]